MLEALAVGANGEREDGVPAFFGVVGLEPEWRWARARGDYLYCDNAFFDCARDKFFRVGRNELQTVSKRADHDRLVMLGVKIEPWRRSGGHIVVACQSVHFMEQVASWPGGAFAWQHQVLTTLKRYTDRTIVVRHWLRDKGERARTLRQDLEGAWACVGHMSAALNEAVLFGVPVFATGPCAALEVGLSQLEQIERPRRPDGREEWAARLANSQWTLDELRSGLWRKHGS